MASFYQHFSANHDKAMRDPYQTLGVTTSASSREIRAAYCRLVKRLHPDVGASTHAEREQLYAINAAYACLRNAATDEPERLEHLLSRAYTHRRASVTVACVLAPLFAFLTSSGPLTDHLSGTAAISGVEGGAAVDEVRSRWLQVASLGHLREGLGRRSEEAARAMFESGERGRLPAAQPFRPVLPMRESLSLREPQRDDARSVPPRLDVARAVVTASVSTVGQDDVTMLSVTSYDHALPHPPPPSRPARSHEAAAQDNAAGHTPAGRDGASVRNGGERRQWLEFRDDRYAMAFRYPEDLLPVRRLSRDARDRLFMSANGEALLRVRTLTGGEEIAAAEGAPSRYATAAATTAATKTLPNGGVLVRGSYGMEAFVERLEVSCTHRLAHAVLLVYPKRLDDQFSSLADALASLSLMNGAANTSCVATAARGDRRR